MTASQRTGYTKRRKQIWEALHPTPKMSPVFVAVFGQELADSAVLCNEDGVPIEGELEVEQVVPPQVSTHGGARPQTQGFASSTAASTGMTKQAINRHLARADALGDDVERITGKEQARINGRLGGRKTYVFSGSRPSLKADSLTETLPVLPAGNRTEMLGIHPSNTPLPLMTVTAPPSAKPYSMLVGQVEHLEHLKSGDGEAMAQTSWGSGAKRRKYSRR